jgi:sulfopropanediol 3-dehydrogenase
MSVQYLKSATAEADSAQADLRDMVSVMLTNIRNGGEAETARHAAQFDQWDGPIVVTRDQIEAAAALAP